MQRPIIAHELTRATAPAFWIKSALKNPKNDDATIARSAVIEGDATITMVVHLMQRLDIHKNSDSVDAMADKIA